MARERTAREQKLINIINTLKAERNDLAEYAAAVEQDRDERPTLESVTELRTKLASDRAKAEFQKAAAGKIRPDALDDAWSLLGYKADPDAETPDVDAITKGVESLTKSRSYLASTEEAAKPTKLEPGEGAARGASASTAGKFVVKESDLGNAQFMSKHQAAIAEAGAAGTLSIV